MSITTGNQIDAFDGDMNTRDLKICQTLKLRNMFVNVALLVSFKKDVSAG